VLFVDTSRKGDRRWCSMSACGNKAKVAGFRKRERRSA
jgi:predicted RNA-binding Zn ribbon-like protein